MCGQRCLSLILTPLLFPGEPADVGWAQSRLALSPHHTRTLPGHGNALLCGSVCVCLCVCVRARGTDVKAMWFLLVIFYASVQRGTVLPYLGHRGVKRGA